MMFMRFERLFHLVGEYKMFLTAYHVTGKPFWEAQGFQNTMEKSPENQLYIYEKALEF